MKKFLVVLFLILLSAAAGYFLSEPVYSFYIKQYYHYHKDAYQHDFEQLSFMSDGADNAGFETLFRRLIIVQPDSRELCRKGAYYFITIKKDFVKGSDLLRRSLSGGRSDLPVFREFIPYFYDFRFTGDIVSILRPYSLKGDAVLLYYYGRSLYAEGEKDDALKYLLLAEKYGSTRSEMFKTIGMLYEEKSISLDGRVNRAFLRHSAEYFSKALAERKTDSDAAISLIRVYTKLGENAKAAAVAGF